MGMRVMVMCPTPDNKRFEGNIGRIAATFKETTALNREMCVVDFDGYYGVFFEGELGWVELDEEDNGRRLP